MLARGVGRLPDADVGMPHRNVVPLGEGEAEQAGGAVEGGGDHAVEGEVGLDGGVVEIGAAAAQLFGVVAPVPRRQREIAAFLPDQLLQGVAVGSRAGARRHPHLFQKAAHGLRRLGHRIVEPVGGEMRVAEQLCGLLAQREDFADDRVVVVGIGVVAARHERLVGFLAQIAPGRRLQERLDRGARQRHHRLAGLATLGRRRLGRGDEAVGQAGAIVLAEFERPRLLVAEQMMAEARAKLGEPLVDRGHARLGGLVEAGAGAAEAGVDALQQALLFGRQLEMGALVVEFCDAAEQHGVHQDGVPVPGGAQRHLALDRQQRLARMRRDQRMEHRRDAVEQPPGALQRDDGVGEVRLRRIVGDGVDLAHVVGERLRQRRQDMLGPDGVERRRGERRPPGGEQRVVGKRRRRCSHEKSRDSAKSAIPIYTGSGRFLGSRPLIAPAFSGTLPPFSSPARHPRRAGPGRPQRDPEDPR